LNREWRQLMTVAATTMLAGCALNYPRPIVCNEETRVAMTPAELDSTPGRRWSRDCANAIAEGYWPPRHANGLSGTVRVEAVFNRTGRPVKVDMLSSSGSEVLDGHALKTVSRAVCPPIPKAVTRNELTIHSTFRYGRDGNGTCGARPLEPKSP